MDSASEKIQYETAALSNEDLDRLLQEFRQEDGVQVGLDAGQYSIGDNLLGGTLGQQPPMINDGMQLNVNAPLTGQNFVNPQQLHQFSTNEAPPYYPVDDHGGYQQRSDGPYNIPPPMHQGKVNRTSPLRPYDPRSFQQQASSMEGVNAPSPSRPHGHSVQGTLSGASAHSTLQNPQIPYQNLLTVPGFWILDAQFMKASNDPGQTYPKTEQLDASTELFSLLQRGGPLYRKLANFCERFGEMLQMSRPPNGRDWLTTDADIIVVRMRRSINPCFKHPFKPHWNFLMPDGRFGYSGPLPRFFNPPLSSTQIGPRSSMPEAPMIPPARTDVNGGNAASDTTVIGQNSPLQSGELDTPRLQASNPQTPSLIQPNTSKPSSSPEEAQPKTPSPTEVTKMPRPPAKDVRRMAEERQRKLQECARDPSGAKLWEHARFGMRDLEQNGVRSVRKIVGDPNSVPLEVPFDYAAHEEAQRQAFIDQQAREAQQALQIQQQQRQLPSKKRNYQEDAEHTATGQKRQKRSMKDSSAIENGGVRMSRAPSGTSQKSAHVDLTTPPPPSRLPDPASLSSSASGWPEDLPRMPLDVYGVQGVELATLNRSIDSPDLPTVAKLFKDPVDPAAREIIETLWYIQEHARRENEKGRYGPHHDPRQAQRG